MTGEDCARWGGTPPLFPGLVGCVAWTCCSLRLRIPLPPPTRRKSLVVRGKRGQQTRRADRGTQRILKVFDPQVQPSLKPA